MELILFWSLKFIMLCFLLFYLWRCIRVISLGVVLELTSCLLYWRQWVDDEAENLL